MYTAGTLSSSRLRSGSLSLSLGLPSFLCFLIPPTALFSLPFSLVPPPLPPVPLSLHLCLNLYANVTQDHFQNNYEITFGCIVIYILRVTLPPPLVDQLIPFLISLFGLNEEDTYFLESIFDPKLDAALQELGVDPTLEDKTILLRRGIGTLIKMLYAFLWQEEFFPGPWIASPEANAAGGDLLPVINKFCDTLTGYPHLETFDTSDDVYPGDSLCRYVVAHAKWHEVLFSVFSFFFFFFISFFSFSFRHPSFLFSFFPLQFRFGLLCVLFCFTLVFYLCMSPPSIPLAQEPFWFATFHP